MEIGGWLLTDRYRDAASNTAVRCANASLQTYVEWGRTNSNEPSHYSGDNSSTLFAVYGTWRFIPVFTTAPSPVPPPSIDQSRIYTVSQWPSALRQGLVAASLLELRVRIPLRAWMFVLCGKDKGTHQDNEDEETSTIKVRRHNKRRNSDKTPAGVWMHVSCFVKYRSLRQADPSCRGVLGTVVSSWMWLENPQLYEA
jgi:hypothetical protein